MSGPEVALLGIVLIMIGGAVIAYIMRRKQAAPGAPATPQEPTVLRDDVVDHLKGIANAFGTEISRLLKAHVAQVEKAIDERLQSAPAPAPAAAPASAPPVVVATTPPETAAPAPAAQESKAADAVPAPVVPPAASTDPIDAALAQLDRQIADATAKRAAIAEAREKLRALVS